MNDEGPNDPYWNLEGAIADVEAGVANHVTLKTMKRVAAQILELQEQVKKNS